MVVTKDKENVIIPGKYFTKVFNREVEVDWIYGNKTKQKRIIYTL